MQIKELILVITVVIKVSHAAEYSELTPDGGQRFGHDSGAGGFHHATLSSRGSVRGSFGHTEPRSGQTFRTEYSAGRAGFIAQGAHITKRGEDLGLNARLDVPNSKIPPPSKAYDFSYNGAQSRREAADSFGDVRGRYSYVDDVGIRRTVDYIAGRNTGFVVTSDVPDPPVAGQASEAAYYRPSRRGAPPGPAGTRGYQSTKLNADGTYRFTHSSPLQRRTERKDAFGRVVGEYSFVDDRGTRHRVQYEAGPGIGFRIIKREPLGPGVSRPQPPINNFNTPDSSTFGTSTFETTDFPEPTTFRPPGSSTFRPSGPTSVRPPSLRPPGSSGLRPPGSATLRPPALRPPGSSALRPPGSPTLRPPGAPLRPPGSPTLRPPGASGLRPPGSQTLRPPSLPLKPFAALHDEDSDQNLENNDSNNDGYYGEDDYNGPSTLDPDLVNQRRSDMNRNRQSTTEGVTRGWDSSSSSSYPSPTPSTTFPSSSPFTLLENSEHDVSSELEPTGVTLAESNFDLVDLSTDETDWTNEQNRRSSNKIPSWLANMQEDPREVNDKLRIVDKSDEKADESADQSSRLEQYQTKPDWRHAKRTWSWTNEEEADEILPEEDKEEKPSESSHRDWRSHRYTEGGSPVTKNDLRYLRSRVSSKTPRLAQVVALDK